MISLTSHQIQQFFLWFFDENSPKKHDFLLKIGRNCWKTIEINYLCSSEKITKFGSKNELANGFRGKTHQYNLKLKFMNLVPLPNFPAIFWYLFTHLITTPIHSSPITYVFRHPLPSSSSTFWHIRIIEIMWYHEFSEQERCAFPGWKTCRKTLVQVVQEMRRGEDEDVFCDAGRGGGAAWYGGKLQFEETRNVRHRTRRKAWKAWKAWKKGLNHRKMGWKQKKMCFGGMKLIWKAWKTGPEQQESELETAKKPVIQWKHGLKRSGKPPAKEPKVGFNWPKKPKKQDLNDREMGWKQQKVCSEGLKCGYEKPEKRSKSVFWKSEKTDSQHGLEWSEKPAKEPKVGLNWQEDPEKPGKRALTVEKWVRNSSEKPETAWIMAWNRPKPSRNNLNSENSVLG